MLCLIRLSSCAVLISWLFLGATVFAQQVETPAGADRASELKAKIEPVVAAYIDGKQLQSVAIGVIDGDIELAFGLGKLSADNLQTPNSETVFEIGSISKAFTGILLADAIERGLVTADQPADDLMPEETSLPVWPKQPQRKINLNDLATHVSGLPRLPPNLDVTGNPANPYAAFTLEQLYAGLLETKLNSEPGKRDAYSNLGYGLLGNLIARKQNVSYEELLLQRITQPLEMKDTGITLSSQLQSRFAPPHNEALARSSTWDLPALAGAGAIRSTLADMLKFARANLNPPENELGNAIELAQSEHRAASLLGRPALGFAWVINSNKTTRWHNGRTGGYSSIMFFNPQQQRAVVVLCNTSSPLVDTLGSEIMAVLAGKTVTPREFRKQIDVSPATVSNYVGRYQLTESVFIDIANVAGSSTALTVQLTGQEPLSLFPESETRWFLKVVPAEIEFHLDESGKCVALTLHQNGIAQRATRE